MNKEQIMKTFKSLANSQGFYGRVVEALENMSEAERERNLNVLEAQHFKDPVELVIYMES